MKVWKVRYIDPVERELTFDNFSQAYEAAVIAAKNGGGIARVTDSKGDEIIVQVTKMPKR
jgi:hypothetical protein